MQAQGRPRALEVNPLAEPAVHHRAEQGCAATLDAYSAPAGALAGAAPAGRAEEAQPSAALRPACSQEPAVQVLQDPARQAQASDKARQAGADGAAARSAAAEPRWPAAPAAGRERAEQAALQPGNEDRSRSQGPGERSLRGTPLLRRMASAADAEAALDAWLAERPRGEGPSAAACAELLQAALERGNAGLALSVHAAMCAPRPAASLPSGGGAWPPATLDSMTALVRGLRCQCWSAVHMPGLDPGLLLRLRRLLALGLHGSGPSAMVETAALAERRRCSHISALTAWRTSLPN